MFQGYRKWLWVGLGTVAIAGAALLLTPVSVGLSPRTDSRPQTLDLSRFDSRPPAANLDLVFFHHSCGGQLLADPGPEVGTNSINVSSPNGGGLRSLLGRNSYRTHETSYGSRFGENTDLFDWLPKFRDHMDEVLAIDSQDTLYTNGPHNRIVVFKSCFPNNAFDAEGVPPGSASGPDLTVANAKAAYAALLPEFQKHPDVLFVCLTTPPLAPPRPQPLWKQIIHQIRGHVPRAVTSAALARQFTGWLSDTNGWLKDSSLTNVAVFDYYDILTGNGASDFCRYATGDGYDSHPSRQGNEKAAEAFIPFLNRAVRRAGLTL
jgi:hypothetical protein